MTREKKNKSAQLTDDIVAAASRLPRENQEILLLVMRSMLFTRELLLKRMTSGVEQAFSTEE